MRVFTKYQASTPQEFFTVCENHDWLYYLSDDFVVWEVGEKAQERLQELAATSDTFQKIYAAFERYTDVSIPLSEKKYPDLQELLT